MAFKFPNLHKALGNIPPRPVSHISYFCSINNAIVDDIARHPVSDC